MNEPQESILMDFTRTLLMIVRGQIVQNPYYIELQEFLATFTSKEE